MKKTTKLKAKDTHSEASPSLFTKDNHTDEKNRNPLAAKEVLVIELSSPSQPKARFYTRLDERDFLGITVWPGKTDPEAEVIVVQLRRRDGDNWETVGRLAVYRTSEGTFSKLPERK